MNSLSFSIASPRRPSRPRRRLERLRPFLRRLPSSFASSSSSSVTFTPRPVRTRRGVAGRGSAVSSGPARSRGGHVFRRFYPDDARPLQLAGCSDVNFGAEVTGFRSTTLDPPGPGRWTA